MPLSPQVPGSKFPPTVVTSDQLAAVATSGQYSDLYGRPTLGTASTQSSSAFATAAQGAKADSALQSMSLASTPPAGLGSTSAVGTATTAARADHVHQGPTITTASASTTAILLAGGSASVTATLSGTMPNTGYKCLAIPSGGTISLLANLQITAVPATVTTVTVTFKNNGLVSVALGQTTDVLAISPSV